MVCLNSSIIIDILRGKESVEAIEERFDSSDEEIFIPSPVIIELIRGIHLIDSIKNIKEREIEEINNFLYSFVVLDFNKESAIKTGEIEAELRNSGEIIDLEDIMIGAIALQNNQAILTRNKKHFERIKGLKVERY